jgi:hypothetical protein
MVLYYNKLNKIILGLIIIMGFCFVIHTFCLGFNNFCLKFSPTFFKSGKEGYINQNIEEKFINIQKLINPNIIFDLNEIEKTASEEELTYFINNGMWYWSKETEALYVNALNSNPYVRTYALDELSRVKTIYSEKAILQILSWQEKEGAMLLTGISVYNGNSNSNSNSNSNDTSGFGDFACNSEEIINNGKVYKCEYDKNGNISMVKKYKGETIPVDYNNLEDEIPGFSFLKGSCNPCEALNNPPSYNCPFTINIKNNNNNNNNDNSLVWKYLFSNF